MVHRETHNAPLTMLPHAEWNLEVSANGPAPPEGQVRSAGA
jgi:hypothetical protein